MPARKTESTAPKRAVSLTLTAVHLDDLAKLAGSHEFPPSLSQMVDRAIGEYIDARRDLLTKPHAKPAKPK